MAIQYSISKMKNPMTGEEKVYAHAQMSEKWNLSKFAQHIADHGSPYTRDTVYGVLIAAVDCLREQLLNGNKVSLGDLGDFYVSLKSNGTETAEEFTSKNIIDVKAKYSKGTSLKNLKDDATFEFVGTRAAQQAARKAEKEAIDNGTTADKDTEPGEETGGSGDGTSE